MSFVTTKIAGILPFLKRNLVKLGQVFSTAFAFVSKLVAKRCSKAFAFFKEKHAGINNKYYVAFAKKLLDLFATLNKFYRTIQTKVLLLFKADTGIGFTRGRVSLLPIKKLALSYESDSFNGDFVLESAWFARYCFTIQDTSSGEKLLETIHSFLDARFKPRASARKTVNLVWDMEALPDELMLKDLVTLAEETNFRLILTVPDNKVEQLSGFVEEVYTDKEVIIEAPTLIAASVAFTKRIVRQKQQAIAIKRQKKKDALLTAALSKKQLVAEKIAQQKEQKKEQQKVVVPPPAKKDVKDQKIIVPPPSHKIEVPPIESPAASKETSAEHVQKTDDLDAKAPPAEKQSVKPETEAPPKIIVPAPPVSAPASTPVASVQPAPKPVAEPSPAPQPSVKPQPSVAAVPSVKPAPKEDPKPAPMPSVASKPIEEAPPKVVVPAPSVSTPAPTPVASVQPESKPVAEPRPTPQPSVKPQPSVTAVPSVKPAPKEDPKPVPMPSVASKPVAETSPKVVAPVPKMGPIPGHVSFTDSSKAPNVKVKVVSEQTLSGEPVSEPAPAPKPAQEVPSVKAKPKVVPPPVVATVPTPLEKPTPVPQQEQAHQVHEEAGQPETVRNLQKSPKIIEEYLDPESVPVIIEIDYEREIFKFFCPYCSQKLSAVFGTEGYSFGCPACKNEVLIPDRPEK
ncbi:MAG: hypothetical protein GX811_08810 [Lentisphaerae bacterium]|nr:hypothetical protein [Lentisphaerota bacterium]